MKVETLKLFPLPRPPVTRIINLSLLRYKGAYIFCGSIFTFVFLHPFIYVDTVFGIQGAVFILCNRRTSKQPIFHAIQYVSYALCRVPFQPSCKDKHPHRSVFLVYDFIYFRRRALKKVQLDLVPFLTRHVVGFLGNGV